MGWRENLLPEVDAVLVLQTVRIGRSTVHEFINHVLVVEAEDPLADEEGLEAEAVQVQGQPLQLFPLQELTRVPAPGCKPLKRLPDEPRVPATVTVSVADPDPGSGAFLTAGSGIRDG